LAIAWSARDRLGVAVPARGAANFDLEDVREMARFIMGFIGWLKTFKSLPIFISENHMTQRYS